jgi:hypothetical protein
MTDAAGIGRLTEDSLRLLADPAQEVLIERRPTFSQLAPVPLLEIDSFPAAELSATVGRESQQG